MREIGEEEGSLQVLKDLGEPARREEKKDRERMRRKDKSVIWSQESNNAAMKYSKKKSRKGQTDNFIAFLTLGECFPCPHVTFWMLVKSHADTQNYLFVCIQIVQYVKNNPVPGFILSNVIGSTQGEKNSKSAENQPTRMKLVIWFLIAHRL